MADYTPRQGSGIIEALRTRYRDMLDSTHALVQAAELFIGGVQPQMDDTDKLAVSIYYEGAGAPGDTNVSAIAPLPVTTAAAAGTTYVDAAAANVHEPAANTAAVVTYAAGGAGVRHFISGVAWSYDAAPTAGSLTITDGGATVFKTDVTAGGPGFQDFGPPLRFTANSAVVCTLAAAGAAVTGIISVKGHWST